MRHEPFSTPVPDDIVPGPDAAPVDCETLVLMRHFLGPILATAPSWPDLAAQLQAKGYDIAFRQGRLVILNADGQALCTGRGLGEPLAGISARIGRPALRLDPGGASATLR